MTLFIFDFDDTLIDNTLLDLDSFRFVAKKYNLNFVDDSLILKWRRNGMIAINILKRIHDNYNNFLDVWKKARLEYLKNGGGGIHLVKSKSGAREVLTELKNKNHLIILVTSRVNLLVLKKILQKLGFNDLINSIYSANDFHKIKKRWPKNNLELKTILYELALKQHLKKIKNRKVIVVGNLKSDIIPAKKMKLNHIAIKGSFRYDSGIKKISKTIENLDEFLTLI